MHYICKKCHNEFDINISPHPHTYNRLGLAYGCLICLKAQAQAKICPKCGSNETIQTVNLDLGGNINGKS